MSSILAANLMNENARLKDRIWEILRDTSDTYAPDQPPHEVAELVELIEQALEGES